MILKQSSTFKKWHGKLKDAKAKAAIAIRLQRLANGNFGDVAPIGEGLSELRIHYGPDIESTFSSAENGSFCSYRVATRIPRIAI